MTFGGVYRGGAPDEHGHSHNHLHESPRVMVIPMVILAGLAVFSGFWNVTGGFHAFMGEGVTHNFVEGLFGIFTHSALPGIALLIALAGIFMAYAIYITKWISSEKIGRIFKPLYTLFSHKYYMDELYENIILKRILINGIFAGLQATDSHGVDGAVNGTARNMITAGRIVHYIQNGQVQAYAIAIGIGVVAIMLVMLFTR